MVRARLIILLLLLFTAPANATIYCVTQTGDDTAAGTSWNAALRYVGTALSLAADGDQVWVAKGVYVEQLFVPDGVQLYGGFAGTETDPSQRVTGKNVTTLDGAFSYTVVTVQAQQFPGTATTLLDGFTIRNGNGVATNTGGGIDCEFSSATITHNVIRNCVSDYGGGIFFACDDGVGLIENNVFTGNGSIGLVTYTFDEAALIVDSNTLTSNDIEALEMDTYDDSITVAANNQSCANTGTGIAGFAYDTSAITVEGNLIRFNRLGNTRWGFIYGTGIALFPSGAGCTISVSLNTVRDNTSTLYLAAGSDNTTTVIDQNRFCDNGDTIYLLGNNYNNTVSFTRNLVKGEQVPGDGGAIVVLSGANPTIADNLIVNNFAAGGDGGGIYIIGAAATIVNNTIVGNVVPTTWGGGGVSVQLATGATTIANNIITANSSGVLSDGRQPVFLMDNFLAGNTNFMAQNVLDEGNIETGVVGFNNADAYDYHLVLGSPCIDAGNDSWGSTDDTDLDGNPRIVGQHVDVGCYEFQSAPTSLSVGNASGAYFQSISLTAHLTSNGTALSNQPVVFHIDGTQVGAGVLTNVNGTATLVYSIPTTLSAGSHTLTAIFAGAVGYLASASNNAKLTVNQVGTKLIVGAQKAKAGTSTTLAAILQSVSGAGLTGETLNFLLDGVPVGTTITKNNGAATITYAVPAAMKKGAHTITVNFAGDGVYAAQTGTAILTVQ